MALAHLTLPTAHVERTTAFLERTLSFPRRPAPANSPVETRWLDIGRGQQFHVTYVEGFEVSRFEGEFGRHIAVFYPLAEFDALKARLAEERAEVFLPLRRTAFERFFFREPINGYVFEVIDEAASDPELR
jgi:hypothetical protein